MKKEKNTRGITLIALVVTMIVLIILATVSINMVFNDNGIIKQAESAKQITEKEQLKEMIRMEILGYQMKNQDENLKTEELIEVLDKYFKDVSEDIDEESTLKAKGEYGGDNVEVKLSEIYNGKIEKVAKTDQSYVGYYADFQDESGNQTPDGIPDGIIYADLAVGGQGTWNSHGMTLFTYSRSSEELKTYTVGSSVESEKFGNWKKKMITEVENSDGAERFYVMALEDIDENQHSWYKNAKSHLPKDNGDGGYSNDFGSGRANTDYWINDKGQLNKNYSLDSNDMWQVLKNGSNTKYNLNKWFVPSKSEWSAFGDMLFDRGGVSRADSEKFGFGKVYWTSSVYIKSSSSGMMDSAFCAQLDPNKNDVMPYVTVDTPACVRLSTTF